MNEQYSIVWLDHSLFIRLSIDGHLRCFYLSAIVKSAAVNMCTQYLFVSLTAVLWGMYPGVELQVRGNSV